MAKVPINSDCPMTINKIHQWTTREGMHKGSHTKITWCKACGAEPK